MSGEAVLNNTLTLLLWLGVCGATAACAASTTHVQQSSTAPYFDEQMAQALGDMQTPCPNRTPPGPGDEVFAIPQVFVESILFEIPAESKWRWEVDGLAALARVPGARFHGSPHIIAHLDETAGFSLETRVLVVGPLPKPVMFLKSTTLRPTLSSSDTVVLEYDIVMQVPAASSASSNSPYVDAHVRNTFVTHERQAVALRAPVPGYTQGELVIALVPYLVRSQVDLRDIFQCKMQRRAEHLRQWHPKQSSFTPARSWHLSQK